MADIEGGGPKPPVATAEGPQLKSPGAENKISTDSGKGPDTADNSHGEGKVTFADGRTFEDVAKGFSSGESSPSDTMTDLANADKPLDISELDDPDLPAATVEDDLKTGDVVTDQLKQAGSGMASEGPVTTDQLRGHVEEQRAAGTLTDAEADASLKALDERDAKGADAPLFPNSGKQAEGAGADTQDQTTPAVENTNDTDFSLKAQRDRLNQMRGADQQTVADQAADGNVLARKVQSENASQTPAEDKPAEDNGAKAESSSSGPFVTVEVQDEAPQPEPTVEPVTPTPPSAEGATVTGEQNLANASGEDVAQAAEAIAKEAAEPTTAPEAPATEAKAEQDTETTANGNENKAEEQKSTELTPEQRAQQVEDLLEINDELKKLGVDINGEDAKDLKEMLKANPELVGDLRREVQNGIDAFAESSKYFQDKGIPVDEAALQKLIMDGIADKYKDDEDTPEEGSEEETASPEPASADSAPGENDSQRTSESNQGTSKAKETEEAKKKKRLIYRILIALAKIIGQTLVVGGTAAVAAGESIIKQSLQ